MAIKKLTIIICTHNRCELLKDCLRSFEQQTCKAFQLLVIDNLSEDGTAKYSQEIVKKTDWIDYQICSEVGLSHARNIGAEIASTEWVGYVDDDAVVPVNFIQLIIEEIKRAEYDAFGGVYYPWYREGRPIWYSDRWGGNYHEYVKQGRRELQAGEYFSGGIAFYRKELISKTGGFDTNFGMKGSQIGYGEENVFQDLIRVNGGKLGINPNISMKHLVADYKLKISWHRRAQFESGKSSARQEQVNLSIIRGTVNLLFAPLYSLRKLKINDFVNITGLVVGACVLVLRSQSYYCGRLWERIIR